MSLAQLNADHKPPPSSASPIAPTSTAAEPPILDIATEPTPVLPSPPPPPDVPRLSSPKSTTPHTEPPKTILAPSRPPPPPPAAPLQQTLARTSPIAPQLAPPSKEPIAAASASQWKSPYPPLQPSATPSFLTNGSGPLLPKFSASTEEILRRVNANAAASAGTPGWEAAREQVLKTVITSDKLPTPPPLPSTRRGRGRGGAPSVKPIAMAPSAAPAPAAAAPTPGRSRGTGRGRGRGAGRGGKRKRAESVESEDESDISDYTPLATSTKSGRRVNKPAPFTPALPSPSTQPRKKRQVRRNAEISVCKVCSRGYSPSNNMIVFCDGCNTAYHQFCHRPPIPKDVVQVAEREWHCLECSQSPETRPPSAQAPAKGDGLTLAQKRAYLSALPQEKLVDLLVHACVIHPNLPIFPPNAESLVATTSTAAQAANPAPSMGGAAVPTSFSSPPEPSSLQAVDAQGPAPHSQQAGPPAFTSPNPPSSASVHPAPQPFAAVTAPNPDPDPGDAYDALSDDGLTTNYPKPGQGLMSTLVPETVDDSWLVEDSNEVFSHTTYYQDEVKSADAGANASRGGVEGIDLDPPPVGARSSSASAATGGSEEGGTQARGMPLSEIGRRLSEALQSMDGGLIV